MIFLKGYIPLDIDSNHIDPENKSRHNNTKQLQEDIMQNKLDTKHFLTNIVRRFGKRNKISIEILMLELQGFKLFASLTFYHILLLQGVDQSEEIKTKLDKFISDTIALKSTKSANKYPHHCEQLKSSCISSIGKNSHTNSLAHTMTSGLTYINWKNISCDYSIIFIALILSKPKITGQH